MNVPPGKESGSAGRGRKPRKEDLSREEEDAFADWVLSDEATATDSRINIDIPMELKYILCCDADLVINQKRLFTIPAKVKNGF